jgi:hypothetical protein
MAMNKVTTYLIGSLGAVALLFGGVALGNVLRDDPPADVSVAPRITIAAATPADPDSGSDGPSSIEMPRPSAHQLPAHLVAPNAAVARADVAAGDDAAAGFRYADRGGDGAGPAAPGPGGPDTSADPSGSGAGSDEGAVGEPYRPPTMPGGLDEDGTGEPDPDVPYEVGDWVEEVPVEDLIGGPFGEDPTPDEPGFRDPCADVSDDEADDAAEICPEGVGGTILLIDDGTPPDPLSIMRQFYISIGVPLELRCPDLGTSLDGVYRPLFASNNPADFTIRYWPSSRPAEAREITYRSSDDELERWIAKRIAGEPIWANPHGGVHNCPELPLQEPFPSNGHFTFEIEGVDDFGTRDSVTVYDYVPRPEAALGRPPVSFNPRPGHQMLGVLGVPYDPTTEMVYLVSIPRTGPRGSKRSCSDIEGEMLDGRHVNDPSLGRFGTAVMARAPGGPEYDPRYSVAATGELVADEGTRYQLCAWVATPAARSFDRPTVVHRASFLVRAPRQLRVRVSVGGGHADQPLEARSVWVTAANWDRGGRGTFPIEDVAARRAFMLDAPVPMFDSGGWPVPSQTIIEVRGPSGATQLLEVPTRTRCVNVIPMFATCPQRAVAQYDVPIPGPTVGRGLCGSSFGTCDPPREDTFVGNLRLIVERYAGPGGPPTGGPEDGWQIFPHGPFASADPAERPATPRIDTNGSYLRAVEGSDGGRPGLLANVQFDRPVRVEVTPWSNFEEPCVEPETRTVDDLRSAHTFRWDELCFGGTYSLSLLAVDEDGNELDLRTVVDGERTGHVGWGYAVLPKVLISEFTVDVTIDRLGDGIRPQTLELNVGGVSAGTFIASGHPPRCRTDAVPSSAFTRTIRSDGGYPVRMGDSVPIFLGVSGTGDGYRCGIDERFVRVQLRQHLWLDDLLTGDHTFVYDEADAEITVTVRNVIPG